MKIHLLAPFCSGSHQRWAEEYAHFSAHDIRLFSLPGRHWKWRMHGAAVELARQFLEQQELPDLILTTDMLDTATFLALTRKRSAGIPVAVYFHENQLTYPWSPTDEDVQLRRDRHYGWINYTLALAADAVFFNSNYHRQSFLDALPGFLKAFPDYQGLPTVADIVEKSRVLPLGMKLHSFDEVKPRYQEEVPVLLWNHRWEYDKNPEAFFACCQKLVQEGLAFKLIVLGESYRNSPPVFKQMRMQLAAHLLHWGFAENFAEYAALVKSSTILPVTSRQDFFGGSVVEAMYSGVYPLLPDRLVFPEHVPVEFQQQHFYQTDEELFLKLSNLLANPQAGTPERIHEWGQVYAWQKLSQHYDDTMASVK